MGSINTDGTGILGNVLGTEGTAGVFHSSLPNHNDVTLLAKTSGEGNLSSFHTLNPNNSNPAIAITHEGNGNGLKIDLTNSNGDASALDIHHEGSGTGIYSQSEQGTSGTFDNANDQNTSPVVMVNTNSLGSSMVINSTHGGLGSPTVDINFSGVGTGIDVNTASGNPATFTISGPESTKTNLIIQQNGTGKGIYLNQNNTVTNNAALDIVSQGKKGIVAQVNGDNAVAIYGGTGAGAINPVGVKGLTYPDASNGIGVLGVAGVNDANGIGVKGIAGGANSGGIGVLGETSANTPQAIAVKGIGYTHNEDVGAITGLNMTDGVGVFGEALGLGGIGVAGTVGNTNNNSIAAKFRNNYSDATSAVMELISNGKGTSLFSDNTNLNSSATMVRIRNAGTGKFLTFENNLGSIITSVDKSGNMITDGTITVKENKGIVRNSTSTQLRTELLSANIPEGEISHYDEFNAYEYVSINFSSAFSAPPAVFLGNIVSGNMGGLRLDIEDVTTTGFTIVIKNYTPYDFTYGDAVFKVMAIGPE